jgi:hypothetical protein
MLERLGEECGEKGGWRKEEGGGRREEGSKEGGGSRYLVVNIQHIHQKSLSHPTSLLHEQKPTN